MGIKHFFTWFRNNFPDKIQSFATSSRPNIDIDNFMIDLNGLFHNSAQKIFQYGNCARPQSLLRPNKKLADPEKLYVDCYRDICETIDSLVSISNPKKRLIMAIDGVAPLSKQNQQRQRRYRGIIENPKPVEGAFDSNCITPGTTFMHNLSEYIDLHVRKNINSGLWKFEVVFSNEKCPGEGEHKLINFIRKFDHDETYCINALDADLFMLALGTNRSKFYLLREDLYSPNYDYMYVNIGDVKHDLVKLLNWDGCVPENIINDFILICFLCGNDFLPNIPSISIMEDGLDMIISFYKTNSRHLANSNGSINIESLKTFLEFISSSEKSMMIQKIQHKDEYIEDTMLSKWTESDFKLEDYKSEYNVRNFSDSIENVSHCYLRGCEWVLSYYLNGISNWEWMYKYSYAPFASDIVKHIDTFVSEEFVETHPLLPIQQLLCVLPPKSFKFVSKPFDKFYEKFPEFYPDKFIINYEGKKKKWEGIVELPSINVSVIKNATDPLIALMSNEDVKRNAIGYPVIYVYSDYITDFKSPFGNIKKCRVDTETIIF